jgi:hypothetical protein
MTPNAHFFIGVFVRSTSRKRNRNDHETKRVMILVLAEISHPFKRLKDWGIWLICGNERQLS